MKTIWVLIGLLMVLSCNAQTTNYQILVQKKTVSANGRITSTSSVLATNYTPTLVMTNLTMAAVAQQNARTGTFAFAALTTTTNVVFSTPFPPGTTYSLTTSITGGTISAATTIFYSSLTTNGFTANLVGITGLASGTWKAVAD